VLEYTLKATLKNKLSTELTPVVKLLAQVEVPQTDREKLYYWYSLPHKIILHSSNHVQ
jgi:hypothetical protein